MTASRPTPLPFFPDLERLRENDDAEWRRAYPLLWTAAMATARDRLGDGGDLENLTADLLCNEVIPGMLGQRGESFVALGSFEELLRLTRSITVRRCIDEIRKRCRRKEVLVAEVLVAEVPEMAWFPEDATGRSGLWCEWMMLIQRELDPPDHELFHDRFSLGITTREIAQRRGMPHGTVVSRFARALKRLSVLLKSAEPQKAGGVAEA
jgi:DNA-directed RNA polymerase specialized sigma24 family protein